MIHIGKPMRFLAIVTSEQYSTKLWEWWIRPSDYALQLARPVRILPARICSYEEAVATRNQPAAKGSVAARTVFRRPHRFMTMADNSVPTAMHTTMLLAGEDQGRLALVRRNLRQQLGSSR